MSALNRKFFSGDTLQQALVQAANQFHLDPEEIAYRVVDKRHGFLKTRRKVMIEVDGSAPRRPDEEATPPPMFPVPGASRPEDRRDLRGAIPLGAPREGNVAERPPRPERPDGPPPAGRSDRSGRPPRRERSDRPDRPRHERPERAAIPRQRSTEESLVVLPERPQSVGDRYPRAEGPGEIAARKAIGVILEVCDLELQPEVYQAEDHLIVDLQGPDAERCFEDQGELLGAIEYLLPRLVRGVAGETFPVRVDCDNFHQIREEQLRTLAQRMAAEVRSRKQPRTLEPMNPADRRIVHVTLTDDPNVTTESLGEGYFKRVTIKPA
jgi:spoIIIJ-associated protein